MRQAGLSEKELAFILEEIKNVRVGTLGDICLDVYWEADMRRSSLSRETPHYHLPVVTERNSPGAGGNVAMNVAELGVGKISILSIIGSDWRGRLLLDCFEEKGIDTKHIIVSKERVTHACCKPIRTGISDVAYEDPRLDFENFDDLPAHLEILIIEELHELIKDIDTRSSDVLIYPQDFW